MGQSVLFYHYRSDLQNLATDRTLRFVLKAGEVKPAFSACRVAIVWLCSRYSAIFEALESLSWISTPQGAMGVDKNQATDATFAARQSSTEIPLTHPPQASNFPHPRNYFHHVV